MSLLPSYCLEFLKISLLIPTETNCTSTAMTTAVREMKTNGIDLKCLIHSFYCWTGNFVILCLIIFAAETSTLSDGSSKESSNEANPLVDIVRQMFDHTKAKFMDMIEKVAKLMGDLFSSPPPPPPSAATNEGASATAGPSGPFERKLQASFMLSLVVLLIVVVSRAKGAR